VAEDPPQDNSYDAATLSRTYSQFFVQKPSHRLNLQTKARIDLPDIKADFNRAAGGTDVVSDDELTKVVGWQTKVYRPNPLNPDTADATEEIRDLLGTIEKKVATGKWTTADIAEEEKQIAKVAAATGVTQELVWAMTKNYEQNAAFGNQALDRSFGGAPPSPLKAEIGHALGLQAMDMDLSPAEQQRLDRNLARYAAMNKLPQAELQKRVKAFKDEYLNQVAQRQTDTVNQYNIEAAQSQNGTGVAYNYHTFTPRYHTAVPKEPDGDPKSPYVAWGFDQNDLPGKPPPYSKELGDFLTSLHEAEHLTRQQDEIAKWREAGKPPTWKGMPDEQVTQAGEIDSDLAVMKYLDAQNEPGAKEYWLQGRQVESFAFGVVSDNLNHDTATFLRVYQQTGKQIDLEEFENQKHGLMEKIRQKANIADIGGGRGKTGDIMGAVQDVLADDAKEKDPNKKLKPVQRAEAESFLTDATALGYKANPDYPRKPDPNVMPQPKKYDPIPPPPEPPKA
jgi:hypothetical protein